MHLSFVDNGVLRDNVQSKVGLNGLLSLKHLELTFESFTDSGLNASDHLCSLLAASPNLQSFTLVHYSHPCTLGYNKLASLMSSRLTELAFLYCKLDFNELLGKLLLFCDALQRLSIVSPKGHRVR